MLNLQHLGKLHTSGKRLDLNFFDEVRWLWSYYGKRLPGGRKLATTCADITIRAGLAEPLRVTIRNNGFDYTLVEEIFGNRAYAVPLHDVRRVLDLGGNIGLASLFFARTFPDAQICAVEPIASNLALLERNVKGNRASVRIVPAAVGREDGKVRFVISEDPRQHSSEATGFKVLKSDTVEVDRMSVPTILKLMGWERADLVKIDIEGGETEVLGGRPAWLNQVRAVIGEGHMGVGYTIDACRSDLEPMGFEVKLLEQRAGAMLFLALRRNAEMRD